MNNIVTLGSIATLKTGPFGTQFSASEYTDSGIPVINVRNIGYGEIVTNELEYVSEQTRTRLSEHTLRVGDIVFGRKGSVDRHAYIDERYDGWVQGSDCIRVRCNSDINTRYLSHFLKLDYVKNQINNAAVGSTMASLNTDILGRVKIVLPSKGTQDKIERILSALEEKIETNRTICAELESMAKTLYDYWFVQFDFPDENGKPYRASGGKMVWNEQLKREIPEGWNSASVGELLKRMSKTPSIPTSEYALQGSIPIIDQSTDFIAGYTEKQNSVLESPSGYIVFGDHTRIVKYILFPFARGADGTQVLDSISTRMPNELFYQAIKSIDLSSYGYARHFKYLKEIPIALPEESIAKEYVRLTRVMYEKQVQMIKENIELKSLRDWLLPMLMNGQATVMDEPPAEQVLSFPQKQPQQFTVKQAARSYSPNEEHKDDTADLLRFYMERKK